MSKLLGFGLIVTGMLVGGVAVPLSASAPDAATPVVVAAFVSGPQVAPQTPGPAATQVSSQTSDQLTPLKEAAPVAPAGAAPVRTFSAPALKPLPTAVASASSPLQAAPSEPRAVTRLPAAPAARKPIVQPFETVTVPEDPAAITRALQVELARVGCYVGPATGFWGPDTRRAMKAFTNRVNASLPIDKPDVILLSLVRAQPASVCGKACPAGQDAAGDGRCVPKAVLAQAARKGNPALASISQGKGLPAGPAHQAAAAPKTEPPAKPETVVAAAPPVVASAAMAPVYTDAPRMALAGPKAEDVPAAPAAAQTPAATPEKPAASKHAKKRERRDPPAGNASYGQTRWAREFFRNNVTF